MDNNKTLANCCECGKLFVKTNRPVCKKCSEKHYSQLRNLSSYIEKNPTSDFNQILNETKLSEKKFNTLMTYGKFWSFKELDLKCRICNKPIPASSGKLLCSDCQYEVAINTKASHKIKKLRHEIKRREQVVTDMQKYKQHVLNDRLKSKLTKKYSFKNSLKENFDKYIVSSEAEMLPTISEFPNLKLSNKLGLASVRY